MTQNIVDVINQEPYRQKFGIIVRILRVRNRFTLRGLGNLVNLSHAHLRKIELGKTSISENVFHRLMNVYHFELKYDPKIEEEFEELWELFHESIIQLNNINMKKYYALIQKKADVHKTSLWMFEYQIVEMAYQCQALDRLVDNLTLLYDELYAIEPLINAEQKPLYYIYMANYYFHIGLPEKSAKSVQNIFDLNTWDKYTAMANYLIGMAYSKTFSLQKSNLYFKSALTMFEDLNYHIQVKATHVFIAANNVKMSVYDGTLDKLIGGIKLSLDYELRDLLEFIYMHIGIYYIKQSNPLKALEYINKLNVKTNQSYFYKAYAYYMIKDYETLRALIKESFMTSKAPRKSDLLYHYALKALLVITEKHDALKNDVLKNFFEECKSQSMFFEIDIAYDLYKSTLIEQRRHKDAYYLTKTMVDITKNAFD